MRYVIVAMAIVGATSTAHADGIQETICLNRAQAQGAIMQARKDGVSLSDAMRQVEAEDNPDPANITPEMERASKNAFKKLAIAIYSMPYQNPDKFIAETFKSCMKEKPFK